MDLFIISDGGTILGSADLADDLWVEKSGLYANRASVTIKIIKKGYLPHVHLSSRGVLLKAELNLSGGDRRMPLVERGDEVCFLIGELTISREEFEKCRAVLGR